MDNASSPLSLKLDDQLCFSVYSTMLALNKLYRGLLKPHDLTYPQYLVLMALWENEDVAVADIGARLHLDYPTITPLLKRLEAQGWVTRQRSKLDERQVRIGLTDAGRALKGQVAEVPRCAAEALGCSLDELALLRDQLNHLRDTVTTSLGARLVDSPSANT